MSLSDYPLSNLRNYENESETFTTELGILDSYDILYLQGDETNPVITINNPDSDESASPTYLSITTNEETSCTYSVDGSTNISLDTTNNLIHTKSVVIVDGSHTIRFYCTDDFGNLGSNSVVFLKSTISSGGGSSSSSEETNISNLINQTTIPQETKQDDFMDNLKNNWNIIYNSPYFWLIVGALGVGFLIYWLGKH